MKKRNKGLFVTFEGGEGAGKTTLINHVFDSLTAKGHSVVKTLEPGGTKLGKSIRELLLHQEETPVSKRCELFLFLADRAHHVHEVLIPALDEGKIVLCDRYNDSTLAYQGAARSLDVKLLRLLCAGATEGLTPDLTLFLDLDPKVGLQRAKKNDVHDRLEKENLDFHTKVREGFHSLAEEEPERFHMIDASQDIDTVCAKAMTEIESVLCLK
ncbi:MAG: dTMP kinase [Simkaniaceae bacterium]|nr:MAG: dTMP kinase [Simkaniaceae bacterium]